MEWMILNLVKKKTHILLSYLCFEHSRLAVQKSPVLCDLCLQLHLDVEEDLIICCLVLSVAADVAELLLQSQDDLVVLLYLHVVAHLHISQSLLQGCFLS